MYGYVENYLFNRENRSGGSLMSKKLKKGIVMSTILASSLLFGAMGASAESNVTTNKEKQAFKSVSTTKAAATVSKKGVFTFPKKYSMTTVTNELKPEAAKLIKIYGDALGTGKTTAFNTYVNQHVAEKSEQDRYLLGRKYTKDKYSQKVKAMRKANAKIIPTYSKAVKQVTTSKVKVSNTYKGTGFATFTYEFRPNGFNAFGTVTVKFSFTQLKNGNYALEDIYYIY